MTNKDPLVLVVDDNEMNRDMLVRRLRRLGYPSHIAEDGEAALKKVQADDYDLILLDIMMPNLNGYEVLERLKTDESTRSIPVIMISAVDDLESVVRCIEMGAEDYLFKPFNPVLLKARVNASLSRDASSNINLEAADTHLATIQAQVTALLEIIQDDAPRAHLMTIQEETQHLANLLQSNPPGRE